uniref:EGF-like domain-containing protein n=1 Tax=Oryza nivara TaxID=4536 RepID=A0A0E0IS70_ORYNI
MDLTSLAGTVDSACFNTSISLPNSPRAASRSLTVSCVAVNCGPGGQCVKEEGFSYHCACSPGFVNMLNLTELPCIKNCAFGKDCAALGLSPASTPAPAPTPADRESSIEKPISVVSFGITLSLKTIVSWDIYNVMGYMVKS